MAHRTFYFDCDNHKMARIKLNWIKSFDYCCLYNTNWCPNSM